MTAVLEVNQRRYIPTFHITEVSWAAEQFNHGGETKYEVYLVIDDAPKQKITLDGEYKEELARDLAKALAVAVATFEKGRVFTLKDAYEDMFGVFDKTKYA